MPLVDSLVSYFSLSDLTDAHGSNHLTNGGSATFVTGKIGNGADLEAGSSQSLYRDSNTDMAGGDTQFTIAYWVNLETLNYGTHICHSNDTGASAQWMVRGDNIGNTQFLVTTGGYDFTTIDGDLISAGTWAFIVAWHDSVANTINIQVNNGTPDSVSYSSGTPSAAGQFTIGNRKDTGEYGDGIFDEVAFWRRILTSGERTELYNGGSGRDYAYISGGGAGITATLAVTLGAATLSATAKLAIAGSAAITLAPATLSASAVLPIVATAVSTLGAATLAATGTLTSGASGSVNVTLAAATLAATGTLSFGASGSGAVNVTLGAATLSSLGLLAITGSVTVTLAPATLMATESPLVIEVTTGFVYGPSSTAQLFGPSSTAELRR